MLDLSPIQTFTSAHDADVKYTIRPLTALTRARAESKTIIPRRDVQDLEIQAFELGKQLKILLDVFPKGADGEPLVVQNPSLITPEMLAISAPRSLLMEESRLKTLSLIAPEFLREALQSISGVTLDGKPATVEQFIQAAPPKLFDEAYQLVTSGAYIDPDASKNSEQSTTSGAVADSEATASIAPSVNPEPITSSETVIGISVAA